MKIIVYTSALALILGIASVQASDSTENPSHPMNSVPSDIHGEVNKQLTGNENPGQHPAEKALLIKKQFENPRKYLISRSTNKLYGEFDSYMALADEWHIGKVGPITFLCSYEWPGNHILPHIMKIDHLRIQVIGAVVGADIKVDKDILRAFMRQAIATNPNVKVTVDIQHYHAGKMQSSFTTAEQAALVQEFQPHLAFSAP